jgi:energy-coupling factor transporter ATP-binding protein EcfA2
MAYTTPNLSADSILLSATPNISSKVLEILDGIGHPVPKSLLEIEGAQQGIVKNNPVLALPMHSGDYHCVNYSSYFEEPRFLNAKPPTAKSSKSNKPRKVKLGLLGVDDTSMTSPVIYLTEGIWDYLTLKQCGLPTWGLPGVNNFDDKWLDLLKDKVVIFCFDNDHAGAKWSQAHAKKVSQIARYCKIIKIPHTFKNKSAKDITDIFKILKYDKEALSNWIGEIIEDTKEFDFPVIDKVREVIINRGNATIKAELITKIILDDIEEHGGIVLPFNKKQEIAIIINGQDVLTDKNIDIYLSEAYHYLPTIDIWKQVKGSLYNHAIREHGSIKMHTYSTYQNKALYFGIKGQGLLKIDKRNRVNILQGTDEIYCKSANRVAPVNTDKEPVISKIEDLLDVFNYDDTILTADEQKFLIQIWLYNTFFNFDTMQPILCAIGDSGCGKSQLFKFLKGILFGFSERRNYTLNVIPEDDHERSLLLKDKKYLFFDEVNENSAKVKKFLRIMATGIEETFRPKYERHNVDFIPEANLGINGLNLVASREYDIAKRLCLIHLARLSTADLTRQFGPEYIMYQRLDHARPHIWENMVKDLQKILGNLEKHKGDYIKLPTPCRFMGLANFAWQAWPKRRDLAFSLFSKMDGLQSWHSADMDPLMDIVEEWIDTEASQHVDPDRKNITRPIKTKTIFKDMLNIATENKTKYFPKSHQALGHWFAKREAVLNEAFGYIREKNDSTKCFEHRFALPEKEVF